jgi:tripartite-type tricarboxylate transporter receptor subunit TctC
MMRFLTRGLCCALLLLIAGAAGAEDWPTKPIRMLVGSSPGGGTDAMARAVADKLGPALKTVVIVENRPGVSNTLAADATAKATDGHTLVMGVSTAHAIAPHLLKLNYDNARDLVPVVLVGSVPNVLVVTNSLPVDSVSAFVKLAKAQPGTINYASSGVGSTQHLAGEIFKDEAGVDIVHVPYRGSGPAMVDLIGGQIQASFDTMPSVIGHIRNGKVKPLAVTTPRRSPQLPNVPTMKEAGYPGVEIGAWYGIYMPASTPKAVQERVHAEVTRLLAQPDTRARLEAIGAEIGTMTQQQFIDFNKSELARYGAVIKKNDIHLD